MGIISDLFRPIYYPITDLRVVSDGRGYKWYLESKTKLTNGEWRRRDESFIKESWNELLKQKLPIKPSSSYWYNFKVNKHAEIIIGLQKYMLETEHFRVESIPDEKHGGYKQVEVCDPTHPDIKMIRDELYNYLCPSGVFSRYSAEVLERCDFRFEISDKYGWIQAVFHDTNIRRLYYRLYADIKDAK